MKTKKKRTIWTEAKIFASAAGLIEGTKEHSKYIFEFESKENAKQICEEHGFEFIKLELTHEDSVMKIYYKDGDKADQMNITIDEISKNGYYFI